MEGQYVWHWRYDSGLETRAFFKETGWLEIWLGGAWFVNKYCSIPGLFTGLFCIFRERKRGSIYTHGCSLLVPWYSVNVLYALLCSPYPRAPLITAHITHSNFLRLPLVCISPVSYSLVVCLCLLLYRENQSLWTCTLPTPLFTTSKPV